MSQQYCFSFRSCSTCAGATATNDGACGWCSRYGPCTPASSTSCNGYAPDALTPSACPPIPAAATAAWSSADALGTLSIGFLAIALLAILVFSPVERLCGRRAASAPSVQPRATSVRILFAASSLMWLGVSLLLAAPAAPWIIEASQAFEYFYVNAFSYNFCRTGSSQSGDFPPAGVTLCVVQPLDYISAQSDDAVGYVNSAKALGGLALVFTVALLLPAALMASVAAYRMSLLERFGTPPYTAGCSLASLAVAQALAWTGAALAAIVWFCALALVDRVVTKLGPSVSLGTTNLPGEVLCGVGVACTAVGAALVSVVARWEARILGVGCNGGGCCKISFEAAGGEAPRETTALLDGAKKPAPVFMTAEN
jgi:hypothetical protein